jgi:ketosteroid isomerase-like protein
MRNGLRVVALVVSVSSSMTVGTTAAAQVSDDASELTALEHRLAEAWVDGDRAWIEELIADDWAVIDIFANRRTKAEVIGEMFANGDPPIAAMAFDEIRVRLFGDLAVVTGRNVATGTDGTTFRLRFTDVFERRDGRWRAIASQGTQIAQ